MFKDFHTFEQKYMEDKTKDGRNRGHIQPGQLVEIVLKADQRTGNLTEGVVSRILTKSAHHPHGIKVMLESGEVGRVQHILED